MVMVRTKMAETLKEAVTFIEQVGGWVKSAVFCRVVDLWHTYARAWLFFCLFVC